MRLKSFYGPNLTEAMRQVRASLGDNAIIVATRDDDAGGIRVTAATDDTPPNSKQDIAASESLRSDGSESIEVIADALLRHHVPASLAERLLATSTQFANEDPVVALGAAFDTHLKFQPFVEEKMASPILFVGPPGAGKTLCAAKFATKCAFMKAPVAVISADTERAGGMEHLAIFTRLLKLKLIEIEDAHALQDAVAMQPTGAAVLIDTPGINPFHAKELQHLSQLIKAAKGEVALVLPAGLDSSEALDIVAAFQPLGIARLLLTQLDVTRRLGSLLRLAFESRLSLANFSATSKVTESPQPFNPVALARLILPSTKQGEAKASGPRIFRSGAHA
ncbi:MAG: GTPase [Alphaproteobacteria bacterium]|nr:GTPase [Alphaproteobacteria bacterium]